MAQIATINDIPVYNAEIGENEGMICISLVDCPAVITEFIACHEDEKPIMFAVQDEEKRRVLGVVMRADFPIYRYSEQKGEFYMVFRPDAIRKMAQKYLRDGYQNIVDLDHDGEAVSGVEMVQWFIKDSTKGVNPSQFDKIADGSLFAEFQITNNAIWEEIKNGTYAGFSLEGYFSLVPERDGDKADDMAKEYQGEFNKLNKMAKFSKVKNFLSAIGKVFVEFGVVTTDKGILAWDGEGEIKVGDKVLINKDGEQVAPEDGDYKTEDGTIISVAGGEVTAIAEPEAEEEPAPEETETAEEAPTEEPAPAEEEPKDDPLKDIIARLEAIEAWQKGIEERITALEGKPAAEEAHANYKKEVNTDNRAAYLASLLKR